VKRFPSRFAPHLFAVVLIFYCSNVYWGGTRWKGFFLSDANGYYAYLPALFIYHDWNFSFIDDLQKKYFSTHNNFDFRLQQKSSVIDKWYCGTAISILPFFLLGHTITHFSSEIANGYTYWYAWSISIAAIFYCFVGLLMLQRILKHFLNQDSIIALVLFLVLFSMNLFYYSTSEPLMSHVYSFAFINLFVFASLKFLQAPNRNFIFLSAFILGMIVLIRPVNGFIIFIIPFLAGSKEKTKEYLLNIFKSGKTVIISLLIFASVLFIQLVFYKLESGSFFIYSYGNEKMNLLNPHLFDFLFSYRKGLFIYLPLLCLSLYGLIFLWRVNRWQFYSLTTFLFILLYLFSSWWNWWYGGSFGTRPIVEYLVLFAILLSFAIEGLKGISKKIFLSLCFLCFLIYQVQNYQYRYYFIHWDKMTKERYWNVFMRVDLVAKKDNPNADLLNE
jgi:hypothetical protein